MKRYFITLLAIAMLAPRVSSACDSLCVRLMLGQLSAPPSIPVSIAVELENGTSHSLSVPRTFSVVVTAPSAEAFRVAMMDKSSPGGGADRPEFTLKPHDRITLAVPVDFTLVGVPLFNDERMAEVGTYKFVAEIVGDTVTRSEPVTFRVAFDAPSDPEAWAFLKKKGDGRWPGEYWAAAGQEAASEISRRFPESSYAYYSSGLIPESDDEKHMAALARAIAKRPDAPFADALRVGLASFKLVAARNSLSHKDLERAQSFTTDARQLLDLVSKNPRDKVQGETAARAINDSPSNDELAASMLN